VREANEQQGERAEHTHHAVFDKAQTPDHDFPGTVAARVTPYPTSHSTFNAANWRAQPRHRGNNFHRLMDFAKSDR
jgi:hypothetical protein